MSSPIRVLVLDHVAVDSARREVYRRLAQRAGFEVHLLVPQWWREHERRIICEREESSLLKIHESGFLFGARFHRVIYTGLLRALRVIKPHVLYVDAEPENYAAVEAIVARRLLAPSAKLALVSSRNLDHRTIGFPYKLSFTHHLCDSIVLRHKVDLVFLRTKAVSLMASYSSHTCYLPFSVDCSYFMRNDLLFPSSPEEDIKLGYVGRLVESKGIKLLVEALSFLPENVSLSIVGNGPLLEELWSMARKLKIDHRVRILPAVQYHEVPRVLNELDILVLPSLNTKYWVEQCPRILIEAMACEVPIVASESGGIPDLLMDSGLLFRVGDRDDLVEKLLRLVRDPNLRAEMAAKGRKRALEVHDVSVVADWMAEAILEALRL